MMFTIPRRGLSPIFVEIHTPNPYEIDVIKNVDTNIIIDPLYLDHPEDLSELVCLINESPWYILRREVDNILSSEEIQYAIRDMAAISGQSVSRISNALRNIYFMKARRNW